MDPRAAEDEGALVASGSFRLDRARAVDKLAHFQLDDPRRYVAELVAAAVCAGATALHVRNDADDFELEWDGLHPTKDELDGLFDAIFYRGRDPRQRMLQHLAQGLFGAAGLDPRWVRLQRPGLTVELTDPAAPVYAENDRTEGVRVEVRERFSWGVLREWSRKAFAAPEELQLLRAVAVACPVPIFVEGRPLSLSLDDRTGPPADHAVLLDTTLADTPAGPDGDGEADGTGDGVPLVGAVWLVEADSPAAGVVVVRDGIVVDQVAVPVGPLALAGHLRCDAVALDASQAGVVRRGIWPAVLGRLEDAARQILAALLGGPLPEALPLDALQEAGLALLSGPDDPLAAVPLFADLAGEGCSLAQLVAAPAVWLCADPSLHAPELAAPQLAAPAGLAAAGARLAARGVAAAADGPALHSRHRAGRRRRAQLAAAAVPLAVSALVVGETSAPGLQLVAGLGLLRETPDDRPPEAEAVHVELRVDGLPVERCRLPGGGPGPVLVKVDSDALAADPSFTAVLPGPAREAALAAAREAALALCGAALDSPHTDDPLVRAVLWSWLRTARKDARSSGAKKREDGVLAGVPEALRTAPLFRCTDGQPRGLAGLLAVARAEGRTDAKGRAVLWTVPEGARVPGATPGVAIVDGADEALLRWLVSGRVEQVQARLRDAAAAARRRELGVAAATVDTVAEVCARAPVTARGGLTGEVGLRRRGDAPACCAVVRERVLLATVALPLTLPGAVAAVAWSGATPRDDWSGLADPEATALALAERLEGPMLALARDEGARWLAAPGALDRPLPPWLGALLVRGPKAGAALGGLPFVRDASGAVHSLDALVAGVAALPHGRRLAVVPPALALPAAIPGCAPGAGLGALHAELLVADASRAPVLGAWLGPRRLRDGAALVEEVQARWARHTARAPLPWALPDGVRGAVAVEGEGFSALLGLDARPRAVDGLTLLLRHDDRPLAEARRRGALPWVAVVRGPALAPEPTLEGLADRSVERRIFEALPAHQAAVLDAVCGAPGDHLGRRLQRQVLAALLARRLRGLPDETTGALAAALGARPLFEDARGALHTLDAVRRAHEGGHLATVGSLPDGIEVPAGQLWLRQSRETLDLLRLALQASPPSADRTVAALRKGQQRRAELAPEPLVPPGSFAASATLPLGPGRVWIGITAAGPARRVWRVDGRTVRTELVAGREGLLLRIEHPELGATPAFDGPAPPALVARLRADAETALATFYARCGAVLARASAAPGDPVLPDPGRVVDAILAAMADRPPPAPVLDAAPLLPVSHGPPRSLATLRRVAAAGPIRVAPSGTAGRPLDPDDPVFLVSPARRTLLGRWGRVVDATADLAAEEAAWQRRAAAPLPPPTPDPSVLVVPLGGPRSGALWIDPAGTTGLALRHEGRPLATLPLPGPLPLCGWAEDPALVPDPTFRRPVENGALKAFQEAVAAAADTALDQLLDLDAPPPLLLLQVALASFDGRRELRRASSSKGRGLRARLAREVRLETADGGHCSLARLAAMRGAPRWVGPEVTAASLDPERPFVRAPAGMLPALMRLLGGEDATARADREARAAALQAQEALPLALPGGPHPATSAGEAKTMRWVAALAAAPTAPAQVWLRVDGRPVTTATLPAPGLVAVVDQRPSRRDPLWEHVRLTQAQEVALLEARAALVREHGPALLADPEVRAAVCGLLQQSEAVRRLRRKGRLPGRRYPARAWLDAPALQGVHGALSLVDAVDAARQERLFWVAEGPAPADGPAAAVYLRRDPTTAALVAAVGLSAPAWSAWEQQARAARREAAAAAEAKAQARERKRRRREVKELVSGFLVGQDKVAARRTGALSRLGDDALDAATTPAARQALAWRLADAEVAALGDPAALVRLCGRVARQLAALRG